MIGEQLTQAAERVNSFLVEALSCQLGILSLSKSDTNELMWTYYASEGKGLAVTFNENHAFFNQLPRKMLVILQIKELLLHIIKV